MKAAPDADPMDGRRRPIRAHSKFGLELGLAFPMVSSVSTSKVSRFQLVLLASSPYRQSSMRPALLLQLLLVVLTVRDGYPSFSCECNPRKCPRANCTQADLDPCTCCPVCVKREGERCGGQSGVEGTCGNGLKCALRPGSVFGWERAGVCEPGELHWSSFLCYTLEQHTAYIDSTMVLYAKFITFVYNISSPWVFYGNYKDVIST